MTAPRSARVIIPEERLHGTGPWLVVPADGPDAAARAAAVREECELRGVATRVFPVGGGASGLDHAKFRALVLVGGDTGIEPGTVAAFRDLISRYRARWPWGLEDLRAGRRDFVDCGVVQLVLGDDSPGQHGVDDALRTAVCVTHRVTDLVPAALFEAYEGVVQRPAGSCDEPSFADLDDRQVQRVWRALQEWGMREYDEVEQVYEIIERCRATYESPRFPALRRPVSEQDLNRLDFVLDDPYFELTGPGKKAWERSGQRVARETTAAITEEMPHVVNPIRKKGAVPSFRDFYRNLKLMRAHLLIGD